jgi:hypothetical protein
MHHLSAATRGQQHKYIVPYSRTTVHKESFSPSTIGYGTNYQRPQQRPWTWNPLKGNPGNQILAPLTLFLIVHIVSPLRKHGCFKLSVKMLLLQPGTLMEEEWTI